MSTSPHQLKPTDRDLQSLGERIRHTQQVIARLREQLTRRTIHLGNLELARGQIVNGMALATLDDGNRDHPVGSAPRTDAPPLATSRKISFTPDERETFYASLARHCTGDPVLDPSTSQLPANFIDNDHDGLS